MRASERHASLPLGHAILPYREDASPQTREFLARVLDVLLDFVQRVNDRNEKFDGKTLTAKAPELFREKPTPCKNHLALVLILEFKMPDEMQKILDLKLSDEPLPLKQLLEDCKTTLKYQVKTETETPSYRVKHKTRCPRFRGRGPETTAGAGVRGIASGRVKIIS
ncbi:Glutamate decarboxylase [Eumeta japonica]|uniref:Glutamate decarboxylase n=1 Tax=Eumeta variegata TaxID=151549 RepID=A0A4C1YUC3_EUMVA|nr:Glutamate decarboxylase [Eumeta japonica]